MCNNGVCTTTGVNAYSCSCNAGYTGGNCETGMLIHLHCIYMYYQRGVTRVGIDLCEQDPCVMGDCINYMTDYECDCITGYEGKNCTSSEFYGIVNKFECLFTLSL